MIGLIAFVISLNLQRFNVMYNHECNIMIDIKSIPIGRVAMDLLGKPNSKNAHQWRYGNKGSLAIDISKNLFNDFEAGIGGDVIDFIKHINQCNFMQAKQYLSQYTNGDIDNIVPINRDSSRIQKEKLRWSDRANQIWQNAKPFIDSPVQYYLENRNLHYPDCYSYYDMNDGEKFIEKVFYPSNLKYHPAIYHPILKQKLPAMVALITDFLTGDPISLHFTFLDIKNGTKANITPNKIMLANHSNKNGIIYLSDIKYPSAICMAEGIESALSIRYEPAFKSLPFVACLSAGNMANLPIKDSLEHIIIYADNDASGIGIKSARQLAQRYEQANKLANIFTIIKKGSNHG